MAHFFTQQSGAPRLYVAEAGTEGRGWFALILPDDVTPPAGGIPTLRDAFPGPDLKATLLFSAQAPTADPPAVYEAAVKILKRVSHNQGGRFLVWVRDIDVTLADPEGAIANVLFLPIDDGGGETQAGETFDYVADSLALLVGGGCKLTLPEEVDAIDIVGNLALTGGSAPAFRPNPLAKVSLHCTGPQRGCFEYDVWLERRGLHDQMQWGFQALIPELAADDPCATHPDVPPADPVPDAVYAWYPLADGITGAGDLLGFVAVFDPTDVSNMLVVAGDPAPGPGELPRIRTAFRFTGSNFDDEPSVLHSYYVTNFGHRVWLSPVVEGAKRACLTLTLGNAAPGGVRFIATPEGDFIVAVEEAPSADHYDLLCGLSGTESIAFKPGDTMRFLSRQGGYAPNYPWPEQSPVSAPPISDKLLDRTYMSSWAMLRSAGNGNHYSSQPKGSSLFGGASLPYQKDHESLLWFKEPGVALPDGERDVFPLVPYLNVVPGDGIVSLNACQLEAVETRALAPLRRTIIGPGKPAASKAATLEAADSESYPATTPSGLIVQVESGGAYDWALLGQNGGATGVQMKFVAPNEILHQALQTNNLFLVAVDATNLGPLTGYDTTDRHPNPCPQQDRAFCNAMNIGEWAIAASVGEGNEYGDYSNLVIVKGRKGKLTDLVANTDLWTQKNEFSCPRGKDGQPAPDQIVVLSLWLQRYFDSAKTEQKDNPFFRKFLQIIDDENWTGILVVKADIVQMPESLVGLLGGIDPTRFNAHHFGIDISPINGTTIEIPDSSSMFGLIYYVDPKYDPRSGATPIQPPAGATYDFKVLTLQVLFANTAVKDFKSLAQLTMQEVFGQPVTRMGDPANVFNSIVLSGALQHQGGKAIYSLETTADNTFYFDSNVLHKVEIVKAQFATASDTKAESEKCGDSHNPGPDFGNDAVSRFSLWGFIDYCVVQGEPPENTEKPLIFDVFSFGNDLDSTGKLEDEPRKGLRFSGLAIDMAFNTLCPTQRDFSFDATKIAFDVAQSTPRAGSLFVDFALQINGLAIGSGAKPPVDEGYLGIITEGFRLSGVASDPETTWYGLDFRLDMGSPGELAGKAGLSSDLMLAWSPGSAAGSYSYQAQVAIKLPGTGGGAKLISLESVMKLSIGNIQMCFIPNEDPSKSSFLLLLTDIALKFLGMLKLPPNGSTSFYLFGNPEAKGQPGKLGWYAAYNQDMKKSAETAKGGE